MTVSNVINLAPAKAKAMFEALNGAATAAAAVFNAVNEASTAIKSATVALTEADKARIGNRPILANAMLAAIKAHGGKVERRETEKGGVQRYLDKDTPVTKALGAAEGVMLAKVIGSETKAAKKHWSVCLQMAFDAIDGGLKTVTATEPKATTAAKARGKSRAEEENNAMARFMAAFAKMTAAPAQPTTGNAFGDAYHAACKSHAEVAKLRGSDRPRRARQDKARASRLVPTPTKKNPARKSGVFYCLNS